MDLEVADIGEPGEPVELHVRIEHPTGLVVHDLLFVEGKSDPHDHRAEDLALGRLHVDDQSAVLHRDKVVHADDAGLDID